MPVLDSTGANRAPNPNILVVATPQALTGRVDIIGHNVLIGAENATIRSLSPTAEAYGLNPFKCRFESDREYSEVV